MTETFALIVAGGRGVRAGGGIPKQYRALRSVPLLRHTIKCFSKHPGIAGVAVVIHPDDRALYEQATDGLQLLNPIEGGATRQDSCRNGLEALASHKPANVLIHDGARPFVDTETISRVIDALSDSTPAVVAAIPVSDTLKRVDAENRVCDTVDRADLWRAQTPQGFQFEAILAAHRASAGQSLTDDASVAEAADMPVTLVQGSAENIKVTTPEDFTRGERYLGGPVPEYRTGTGFDVHAFKDGDHVMLCGVAVPHSRGLAGHSDSDVGLHALTDALLGTIGAGDIGSHFPPSDPQWSGVDSGVFLRHAATLVGESGGTIRHVDLTLICEAPKVGPHRETMRARLADLLFIDIERVSVKATTTEGLGFLGRQEGIAAQAAATVLMG